MTTTASNSQRAGRIFVARLAGLAVFDPNGDQVGRVRDVVVTLRLGGDPPRVVGLTVEVQRRRRIFVSITRVTSIDAGQVRLRTGVVNLRQFTKRAGETLVLEELLDKRVTLVETGASVTVLDCSIEPVRGGEWHVTRVAVGETGGGLVRRSRTVRQVEWDAVTGFALREDEQGAANLLAVFSSMRPADLANVMHDLSEKRRGEVAAALDDERLADVLEELPEEDQIEILSHLEDERAADVLEEMAPDDAADLLGDLPPADAQRLLELMEPEEAAPVRRLLAYADNTAGGMMTSEPIVLPPHATVAEALARIRVPDLTPALASQVYVVRPPTDTPTGRFLGIAHIQRLLREVPSSLVGACVDTDIDPLGPDNSLREVTEHLATYNLLAAPVLDNEQRLLGAVTVDDVLDHLLPANWRDEAADGDGA
ncbi:MAG TPA: CBS domain-containing protein [Mycobacteriales bacterium]|nr:CBS domain-containing protein [Mycobacteriales bacterium]